MNTLRSFPLPVVAATENADAEAEADAALANCSGAESFALMVLGDSMAPEFVEGDIIVIEPEGLAVDGSYVMAWCNDEWIFRQLRQLQDGWWLQALNPAYAAAKIPDLSVIRGVIIQKSKPGRRKAAKRYVD